MRHVLKDAGGRDYFLLTGRIGERWSSAPAYSAEDAVVAAQKILGGEDPRTAKAEPAEAPHHDMPT